MSAAGESIGHRIIRAGLVVGSAHLVLKLVGLVQSIVIGRQLDNATFAAVYAFAFEGCLFTLFLIGEEAIGPALLPVFMQELNTKDEKSAWRFANTVMTIQMVILIAVVGFVMAYPGLVTSALTYWNNFDGTAHSELATRSLVWLAPSLICLSIGSTTYMLLNGYKRFFLAALGDASLKLCLLIIVIIGMVVLRLDYRVIIAGLLVGSVAKLATHLLGLRDKVRFIRPALDFSHPALRSLLYLMAPLLLGIIFAKVRDFYNNVTILTFLDADGLLKANSFGRKLYVTIGWLVPYALSIAMFPFFCEMVDRKDTQKFAKVVTDAGRMLLSLFIPLSLVCVVLAAPISFLLLEGGKFDAGTVGWTALSMACYTLVLPAHALEYLLMQAFFANRRMWSVTIVGVASSALSIAISAIGIRVFGARGADALAVVALGFVVSRALKSTVLAVMLRRTLPVFPFASTMSFLVRASCVGLLAAAAAYGCIAGFEAVLGGGIGKILLLAKLTAGSGGALVGFLAGTVVFRLREPLDMAAWCVQKVRARGKKP